MINSIEPKTIFLMLLSLVVVVAYYVFLFTGNTNIDTVQRVFDLVVGFWFATTASGIGQNRTIEAQKVK